MNLEQTGTYDEELLEQGTRTWFFFMILYLIVDYGRIQDVLPIGAIRPGMITILLLAFMVLKSGDFQLYIRIPQLRLIFYLIALISAFVPLARNNFFAWTALKTMLLYIPFILSTVDCVSTLRRLQLLLDALLVITLWIALYAITHGGVGPGSYFADENDLSLFINMFIPFCYYLFFYEISKVKKLFYLAVLCSGIAAVVISFSRGGLVGLIGVAGVIWLNSQNKLKSLFICTAAAILVFFWAGPEYIQEMATLTDLKESTAMSRIESWKSAIRMFLANPWGIGGYNFQILFDDYQTTFFKRGMFGRVAHSLWFTLIPELGIVGTTLYFMLLYRNLKDIFLFKRFSKSGDEPELEYFHLLSLAFMASLAGYFASGTFLSVLYYAHYWYLTGIIVATKLVAIELYPEKIQEQTEK